MDELLSKLSSFKIVIFCGLPGVGKTTIAKKLVRESGASYPKGDLKTIVFEVGNE